jgi:hypothetical protein
MDNKTTHEFVKDLQEKQEKDKKNKETQGKGHHSQRLPNKEH